MLTAWNKVIISIIIFQNPQFLACFCSWAERFESYTVAQRRMQVFSWRGSYILPGAVCGKVIPSFITVVMSTGVGALHREGGDWFELSRHFILHYMCSFHALPFHSPVLEPNLDLKNVFQSIYKQWTLILLQRSLQVYLFKRCLVMPPTSKKSVGILLLAV